MSDQAPVANGQGAPEGGAASSAALLNTPAVAPAAAPTAAPIPWLEGADELTLGYVQNKGWKEPTDILNAYRNAEKFISAPVDKRLVIPNADQDATAWNAFYDRLGRPSEPAGYKFEMPEGADPEFAKNAQAKMHELGLSKKQGEELAAWWNAQASGVANAGKEQMAQAFQADDIALKAEWGAAFQQNLTAAQAAARGLGLDEGTIDKLQQALGHKATMNLLYQIGSKVGEADFVAGVGGPEKFGTAMTPAAAMARIAELKADKNFVARYVSKDVDAVSEMKRLHAFAYPEN